MRSLGLFLAYLLAFFLPPKEEMATAKEKRKRVVLTIADKVCIHVCKDCIIHIATVIRTISGRVTICRDQRGPDNRGSAVCVDMALL